MTISSIFLTTLIVFCSHSTTRSESTLSCHNGILANLKHTNVEVPSIVCPSINAPGFIPTGAHTQHCLITQYRIPLEDGNGNLILDSDPNRVNFTCDYEHICHEKREGVWLSNINVNNTLSSLYCCTENNCNSVKTLPKKIQCYQGKNLRAQETNLSTDLVECYEQGAQCVSFVSEDKSNHNFFCDTRICNIKLQKKLLNSTGCTHVNTTSGPGTLCCCSESKCNKPVSYAAPSSGTDWMLTGGLIALFIVLIVLIVSAVIMFKRYRRDRYISLSYQRLTADMIDEDTDDESLLRP